MGMLSIKQKEKADNQPNQPKDRFNIGESQCYFEAANYLTGRMDEGKVVGLLTNDNTSIAETEGEGRSLKVLFATGTEVKFVGFITAGDGSIQLDSDDIPTIMGQVSGGVTRAITPDQLVDLF